MTCTPKEIIKKAREVISDPQRWTQHTLLARSVNDGEWMYCALGAVRQAAFGKAMGCHHEDPNYKAYNDALGILRPVAARILGMQTTSPIEFLNDTADHATVLRMFDDALA